LSITPLGPVAKLKLAAEVGRTYVRVRRVFRRSTLPDALAQLRAPLEGQVDATPVDREEGLRLGRAVTRTLGVLPADSRCLMQSLVLSDMLARRGTATTFVIGVRPGQDFLAHAWVELDGSPLLPAMEHQFARLADL
jgi:hypothetical protein